MFEEVEEETSAVGKGSKSDNGKISACKERYRK